MDVNFYHWICHSPNLIKNAPLLVDPMTLSSNPKLLPAISPNPRLGFYYQDCVKSMLDHSHSYQIVADEVQFNHNGQTVGALDFVVQRLDLEEQPLEHWEVAIKFFLLLDGYWHGPNARDRLDLKLNKMVKKQLLLTHHEGFSAQFPQFSGLDSRLLVQGRLYTNPFIDQPIPTHCADLELEPKCINGHWCYHHQASNINSKLYVVEKPYWATGEHSEHCLDLAQHPFERDVHCVDESGRFWFIVPDGWPGG
ncbi:DUF1853 family protein [Vibrio ulleungensis]|uniref:DUF1853 family protein n=1 Tax=Vibrio ulleungensis TaxID=2807619 RepID=A0ABS2HK98_9VIBR|nr:DUF1853 family protein [Vibrio ulleungensis]MBM7036527.1 DUF1853 family protein [Vibrio ulleungensis]